MKLVVNNEVPVNDEMWMLKNIIEQQRTDREGAGLG